MNKMAAFKATAIMLLAVGLLVLFFHLVTKYSFADVLLVILVILVLAGFVLAIVTVWTVLYTKFKE